MLLTTNGVVLLGVAFCCVVIYKYLVYPVFLSPLSRIPNAHPTASISPLWILWARYRFKENRSIHDAHLKHGPVVRLGPKELSVNCVDNGIKTIYSGGFEKHEWYPNLFVNYETPNMFSTAGGKAHSFRKRMMSNVYSKSHVHSSPTMIASSERIMFERFFPRLRGIVDSGGVGDIYALANATTMDLVTAFQFGIGNSYNFLQDDKQAAWWLHLYECRKKYTFWPAELPSLLAWLRPLGVRLVPDWVAEANAQLEASTMALCEAADRTVMDAQEEEQHPERIPVVYRQLKSALSRSLAGGKSGEIADLSPQQRETVRLTVASELLDHLSAGHETSGITLAFLFHELSRRPDLQADLRAELSTLTPPLHAGSNTSHRLPSPKSLDALPLLHAIVMETLRRHPAIPGPQPRVTPNAATTLGAFNSIPPGTRVSSQAYTLHRLASAFPDPEAWQPARWLPSDAADDAERKADAPDNAERKADAADDAERKAEMHRAFWAFSSGGRMCIGSHLAMQQMKLIVAAVVANYDFAVAEWEDDVGEAGSGQRKREGQGQGESEDRLDGKPRRRRGDEGIEQEDAYTARPVGGALWLRFTPVGVAVAAEGGGGVERGEA